MPFVFDTVTALCKIYHRKLFVPTHDLLFCISCNSKFDLFLFLFLFLFFLFLTSVMAVCVGHKCDKLVGAAIGQVWDLIKVMDYLTERPDIDPLRIGMMGISLGGIILTK
jgi:hypothetical protein